MKKYIVYILECSDKSYYTGVTNNITRRVIEHKSGSNKTCYTFNKRPLNLVYYCKFTDVNLAIEYEKKIKKWSRLKKTALISGEYNTLPNLAQKKFS